jgi:hypothetical protein
VHAIMDNTGHLQDLVRLWILKWTICSVRKRSCYKNLV